jgi:prevent-host-death family protein
LRVPVQHVHNVHMRSVNIAELRRGLAGYLKRVRRGEEVVVRDRDVPIARIVPLSAEDQDFAAQLRELAAQGLLRLPSKKLDIEKILGMPSPEIPASALLAALKAEREED